MGTALPVAPNSVSASGPSYQRITTDHVFCYLVMS